MEDTTIVSSIGSCGNGLANSTGSCLSSCSLQEVHKWTGLSGLSCCHTLQWKDKASLSAYTESVVSNKFL